MLDSRVGEYVLFAFLIYFRCGAEAAFVLGLRGRERQRERNADVCVSLCRPREMLLGKEGQVLQERIWKQLLGQLERIQPGIGANI